MDGTREPLTCIWMDYMCPQFFTYFSLFFSILSIFLVSSVVLIGGQIGNNFNNMTPTRGLVDLIHLAGWHSHRHRRFVDVAVVGFATRLFISFSEMLNFSNWPNVLCVYLLCVSDDWCMRHVKSNLFKFCVLDAKFWILRRKSLPFLYL